MKRDILSENLTNEFEVLPVRKSRKSINPTKKVGFALVVDEFTWLQSDERNYGYMDGQRITVHAGLPVWHATGSHEINTQCHSYNADGSKQAWHKVQRERQIGYRRYERASRKMYLDVAILPDGSKAIGAVIALNDCTWTSNNGKICHISAGTLLKCDGFTK